MNCLCKSFIHRSVSSSCMLPLILDYASKTICSDDLVVVLPDVGSVARARAFSNMIYSQFELKINMHIILYVMNLIGDVKGKEKCDSDDIPLGPKNQNIGNAYISFALSEQLPNVQLYCIKKRPGKCMHVVHMLFLVKLIGKLQDGIVFLKKGHNEEEELFEFKTDEEQIIDGLDRAVMAMKKDEVAQLTIAPEYGFGSSESQ
ncbi:hypothetical protein CRYUN_Cryun26dG0107200 [Craigia yunnanensis]